MCSSNERQTDWQTTHRESEKLWQTIRLSVRRRAPEPVTCSVEWFEGSVDLSSRSRSPTDQDVCNSNGRCNYTVTETNQNLLLTHYIWDKYRLDITESPGDNISHSLTTSFNSLLFTVTLHSTIINAKKPETYLSTTQEQQTKFDWWNSRMKPSVQLACTQRLA